MWQKCEKTQSFLGVAPGAAFGMVFAAAFGASEATPPTPSQLEKTLPNPLGLFERAPKN